MAADQEFWEQRVRVSNKNLIEILQRLAKQTNPPFITVSCGINHLISYQDYADELRQKIRELGLKYIIIQDKECEEIVEKAVSITYWKELLKKNSQMLEKDTLESYYEWGYEKELEYAFKLFY